MSRIDVGGLALNVERSGSGPPVVLIHGFTGSTSTWRHLTEVLAPNFEVIAIDVVGHGGSDSPPAVDRYRMRRCTDDLVAALHSLGHDSATWLGYSMGGRTVLQLAVSHPEAVDALILEGATPGIADEAERAARVASDEAMAGRIEREGLEAFVDYWQSIPMWNSQATLPQSFHEELRAQRMANTEVGLANSLRGMGTGAQDDVRDRLPDINVPTLLLTGALDLKFTAIAEEMAAALPDVQRVVIENAGHAAHLEDPATFEAHVAAFLARVHHVGAART